MSRSAPSLKMGREATTRRTTLPQRDRLLIALVYLVGLLGLSLYLNDTLLPPFGIAGLWFYSAFAVLILGEFILEPFFTTPAHAMANGVALAFASASVSLVDVEVGSDAAEAGRLAFLFLGLLIVLLSIVAIVWKDAPAERRRRIAVSATFVVGRIGRARFLWSLVLFAVGYAAFADSAPKVAALYLSWIAIFVGAPIERLAGVFRFLPMAPEPVGAVERIEDPGVVLARMPRASKLALGDEALIGENEIRGVVVDLVTLAEEPLARIAVPRSARVALGAGVQHVGPPSGDPIIGHVGEGTSLQELQIETAPRAADAGLVEGRLVSVLINDKPVLYQVTEALIAQARDELVRRDVVRVTARKLGIWNVERTVFELEPWLPAPGEPVRLLARAASDVFAPDAVGHVPGTAYPIRVDLDRAVTHNTAILGILGVGKTHLAWELVHRMIAQGIKVVALDITGQYSRHFADVCGPEIEEAITEHINSQIADTLSSDRADQTTGYEAGNYLAFQETIGGVLKDFIEGDQRLLILNPNRIEVSRMEGKPFDHKANFMVTLTMVEVTQIVAETLLELVHDEFTEEARVCLVLEEAHSLVPEWSSAVRGAESSAVNGTARAILQGRKYGYGCLLVTQRTANVTKSILNQCNTIFGLRVYDATGMGFLENYVGAAHARLLATLPDRHAVAFGRASSCNAPIIIRLNDAELFKAGYWDEHVANVPPTDAPDSAESMGDEPPDEEDSGGGGVDHEEPPF